MGLILFFLSLALAQAPIPSAGLHQRAANAQALLEDIQKISTQAGYKRELITLSFGDSAGDKNQVSIRCPNSKSVELKLQAPPEEWAGTLYYGLYKLGFSFPHPRMQISPAWMDVQKNCGKHFVFEPRFIFRGYHLHTQHPNEWVAGFLSGENPKAAEDIIRWSARNFQNILQVQLLRGDDAILRASLQKQIPLAHSLGLQFGISLSFAMQQQKSFQLIPPALAILRFGDEWWLERSLASLTSSIAFDYLVVELGTTEFSETDPRRTLYWIERANDWVRREGKDLFVKIHASGNQVDETLGNFNFLPRMSSASVGVLPHTVMFYGLGDSLAPMYGRRNFSDLKDFMQEEVKKRPMWYYPETSYFIGIDIDVPLLLTDYLLARSQDMDFVEDMGVKGHVTFTTGQELGYWLMDWTVALLSLRENRGKPLIATERLGENRAVWDAILDYQNRFFKQQQVVGMLSSANLMDELSMSHGRLHERSLMRELKVDSVRLQKELIVLKAALEARPSLVGVKNFELKELLQVTWNRVEHAYNLRSAIKARRNSNEFAKWMQAAKSIREQSKTIMDHVVQSSNRYPEAQTFAEHENWTSYPFGYGWPAAQLHYWEREEGIIKIDNDNPFFRNIFNPLRLLF